VGYRLLVVIGLVAGCASSGAIGVAGTTASGSGGGFTITAGSEIGFRAGDNVDIGLTSNMHFGNWSRAGSAYGQLNEWASSGKVDCCGEAAPILTFFKYIGLGMGYMTAWMLATNAMMVGPRLRYYVQQYAPTMYFDLAVGPAGFFDEDRSDVIYGLGSTVAVGYMFDPNWGIEARSTWGNIDGPRWATFSVGLVIKPKKRFFGLFGGNDLEKPPPPPPPPQPYPQPYSQQPYPQQPPFPQQPQPAPQPQPGPFPQPQPVPKPPPAPAPVEQPPSRP
jgi:hypothetical protein